MTLTPAGTLPHAPWMDAPELAAVVAALGAPAVDVRFVGGCVRDTVLDRPVTDVDLATPDLPQTVVEKVEAAGLDAVPTGLDHGTVTVVSDGRGFEVTTLRRDTSCDGRHADVEFTTDWVEDASRRDFTFNALSARPDGTLFDPFDGVKDGRAGRVRFVGDPHDRIKEDYLRILRYFRFLAHYGAEPPDKATLDACHDLRSGLDVLSQERVTAELVKMLDAPDPVMAFEAMTQAGITNSVLPECSAPDSLAALVEVERAANTSLDANNWQRRLVFLAPRDAGTLESLTKRLRLSNKDAHAITALFIAAEDAPSHLEQDAQNRFLYTHQNSQCGDSVVIAWAWHSQTDTAGWRQFYRATQTWQTQTFPLRGSEVVAAGIPEGPEIGDLLKALEDEWIDSGFSLSKNELLQRLKSHAD